MIASGHPGTESGGILTLAYRDVLARTATLIVAALDDANPKLDAEHQASPLGTAGVARFAAKSLARAAARKLYGLCYNAPHWRVGWRHVDGPDVIDLRAHPPSGWRDLPDDRSRFYADPFPIEHDGRTFVFVEDFVHALGYGVISAVEFGADGPLGAPRPVLDIGTHLSYPFVFARDGAVFMIPETVATDTLDLYRAVSFPDRWEKEATLLSGIAGERRDAVRARRPLVDAGVRARRAAPSPTRCTSGRRRISAGRGSRIGAIPCWSTSQARGRPDASCSATAR